LDASSSPASSASTTTTSVQAPALSGSGGGGGSGGGNSISNNATPIIITPTEINFIAYQGGQIYQTQSLDLMNTSASPITFRIVIDDQPGWMTGMYFQSNFVVYPNQHLGLGAGVDIENLVAGNYSANIKIVGNFSGSPIVIPVNLTVNTLASNPVEPTLSINDFSLPHATVGMEYSSQNITFNQMGNSVISVQFTGLPDGMGLPVLASVESVVSSTLMYPMQALGTIFLNGMPTQAGSYDVTLTLDNRNGLTKTEHFIFVVDPAATQSGSSVASGGN
jgi:hypothetical protein